MIGLGLGLMKKACYKLAAILCNITNYSSGAPVPFDGDAPAVGYTNLNNDYCKATLPTQPFNYSDGFTEMIEMDIRPEYSLFEQIWSFYEGTVGGNRMYLFGSAPTTIQFTLVLGGVFTDVGVGGVDIYAIKKVCVECSYTDPRNAKTITTTAYDSLGAVMGTWFKVADLTLDFKPSNHYLGTRVIEDHRASINVYSYESDHMGVFDYEIRLWGATDPNGGKIISDLGIESVLQDDSPFGAIYPYIGIWPTFYLIDDRYQIGSSCVTVPAGYSLVINELTGNYVTNELTGNYVLNRN